MKLKVWFGLMAGNVIEYYDYVIYGLMIPVLSRLFFPADNHLASLLATFAVFATGMLIRPVGGVVFGMLGNRVGRKTVLLLSSLMTGFGTFLIGCLPSVADAGITATVLLVILRLIQGMGMSSEFCSVLVISGEISKPENRGFISSLAHSSGMAGTLLGSVIVLLIYLLPEQILFDWGWRLPFLFGGLICFNALLIRRRLPDNLGKPASATMDQFKQNRLNLVRIFMIVAANTIVYHLIFVFQSTHMIEMLGIPRGYAMTINSLSLIILVIFCALGGHIADLFGHRRVYLGSLFAVATLVTPLMWCMSQPSIVSCMIGQSIAAILGGLLLGSSSCLYTELLPRSLRMPGVNIPYNLAIVVFGGTAPLVAMTLSGWTGLQWISGVYIAIICFTGFFLLRGMSDSTKLKLDSQ